MLSLLTVEEVAEVEASTETPAAEEKTKKQA
jgi:hypothetical protein